MIQALTIPFSAWVVQKVSEQIYCFYYRSTMISTPVSFEFSLHHDHSFIISEKYFIQLYRIENCTIWVKLFSLMTSIHIFFFKVNWNFYCYVFLAISKNELNGMSKYVISRLHDLKRRTLQRLKSGICKDRNWNPADLVFGFWNPVLQNPESKTL